MNHSRGKVTPDPGSTPEDRHIPSGFEPCDWRPVAVAVVLAALAVALLAYAVATVLM